MRVPKVIEEIPGPPEGGALTSGVAGEAGAARSPRYDIWELVAAMAAAEQPPLLMDDGPRGTEIW